MARRAGGGAQTRPGPWSVSPSLRAHPGSKEHQDLSAPLPLPGTPPSGGRPTTATPTRSPSTWSVAPSPRANGPRLQGTPRPERPPPQGTRRVPVLPPPGGDPQRPPPRDRTASLRRIARQDTLRGETHNGRHVAIARPASRRRIARHDTFGGGDKRRLLRLGTRSPRLQGHARIRRARLLQLPVQPLDRAPLLGDLGWGEV